MFPELSTRQNEYLRKFPKFGRPQIVGYHSLDGSRRLLHDASRLKFISKVEDCQVNFDLDKDLNLATRSDQTRDEKINHLLQFLLKEEKRLFELLHEEGLSLHKARFMCYRGLLTCIANTPYEDRDGWRIVATLHCGHIFLCARNTEDRKRQKQQMTERDLQFSSWGYKFEQYIVSDTPTCVPDTSSPLDENEEFSLVLSSELGEHRLLYAAEMDGIQCEPHTTLPPSSEGHEAVIRYLASHKFIELKTNRHIMFPKQQISFERFKARKWWCQSFLAGVDTIVCGLRDDRGLVDRLKIYRVADLPRMSKRFWNPDVCFNFLDTFLTYVKRCLAREVARLHGDSALKDVTTVPTTSLHFEWSPRENVRVTEHDPYADTIVPDWFVKSYVKAPTQGEGGAIWRYYIPCVAASYTELDGKLVLFTYHPLRDIRLFNDLPLFLKSRCTEPLIGLFSSLYCKN